jgi:hypothetical protein
LEFKNPLAEHVIQFYSDEHLSHPYAQLKHVGPIGYSAKSQLFTINVHSVILFTVYIVATVVHALQLLGLKLHKEHKGLQLKH